MSRGAALRLATLTVVLAACRPAGPPAGRERVRGREPTVRIGVVVDSPRVDVGATGSYVVRDATGRTVYRGEGADTLAASAGPDGALSLQDGRGRRLGPYSTPLTIVPERGADVRLGGRPYHGTALVRGVAGGGVTAVNVVDLERYLRGVVPMEIGVRPPSDMEAVKAQAVAARTYAIGNLGRAGARGFDFYAGTQDQVYGGASREDSVAARAVAQTRGEIVTYQGQPILAYYSSTCGGRTAAIEDAWPWRAPLPYLKSESDRIPGTDRYYCDLSHRFRWTVRWTGSQLHEVLARTLPAYTGAPSAGAATPTGVELDGLNGSQRVRMLTLRLGGRTVGVRGDSVRWLLRPPDGGALLNSSMLFSVDAEIRGDTVAALEVRGGGWGHGIGMCQWGAIGRARAGQGYRTILAAYYRDTRVERFY